MQVWKEERVADRSTWRNWLPELEAEQPGVAEALRALVPSDAVLQWQPAVQVLQQVGVLGAGWRNGHDLQVYRAMVPAAGRYRGLSSDEVQQVLQQAGRQPCRFADAAAAGRSDAGLQWAGRVIDGAGRRVVVRLAP